MHDPRYSGRPVLVTGASGFTGSWLARRLIDRGASVVAQLRPSHEPAAVADGAPMLLSRFDLMDPDAVGRVLKEHDVGLVFHLAARTMAVAATESPYETFEVNVRGTYSVLEAARRAQRDGLEVRVVVASTYHVYGRQPEAVPFGEDLPLRPRTAYETSKACADMLARSYAATYSLPVAVARLANVYGGGDPQESRLVPAAARALAAGETPVIRSDGTPERDFVYAEDAVDAYLAVAESLDRPELWGRAWNAGADRPVAIADLVRRLIAVAGADVEPQILQNPRPGTAVDRRFLDSSAIRGELGWRPRWDLDAGLAETFRWHRHPE